MKQISTYQHLVRLLFVFLMVVGAPRWGSVVYAYELSGDGTEANPYLLTESNDWNFFLADINNGRDYKNKLIKLTADIDVTTAFKSNKVFKGTFDGNGHTISKILGSPDHILLKMGIQVD